MSRSEILFERAKKVSPGGVHSPVRAFRGVGGYPRFIESAQGAYITDVDGIRYIDFCMSWGPLIFGHKDPEIHESVIRALERGWSYGTAEPYSLALAEFMVSKLSQFGLEKVRFVNSGTEAVMSALRVARAATNRRKIIKFDGCYHGHVDSLLVRAGSGLADMASPDSAGVSTEVAGETIILPLDDVSSLESTFSRHGADIAAVIVEPLPANNGLLPQRQAFLESLRSLTTKYGSLLIFDEVISGFRIGFGGMAEFTGIKPDLLTYGKIIGGGFPVGAYGGRSDLMDFVAPQGPVYQAGTLSGNPVAMTAGLTMLRKLDREDPYKTLSEKTEKFSRAIELVARKKSKNVSVQNLGSIFWTVFGNIKTDDGIVRKITQIPAEQKSDFTKTFHGMLAKGTYLAPSAFEVGFLSTVHTDDNINSAIHSFEECLSS